MAEYIVRRLIYAGVVLFIMTVIVFFIMRAIPGDVVLMQLAESGNVTEEQVAALEAELGLDKGPVTQFAVWFGNAIKGDFGVSLWTDQPVTKTILERMPITLQLTLMATIIAVITGIPIGVISALKHNKLTDHVLRFLSIGGLSIPNFWVALIALTGLSIWFKWIPPLGYQSFFENPIVNLQQTLLPAIVLSIALSASIVRMTRSSLLEVLNSNFIRAVRSKGAKERVVVVKHALRNSIISVITIIGLQVGFLLGGTVIIESIFSLPGLGSLIFQSVLQRDYPIVQASALVFGSMFILVNIVVDVTYGWIDPRIRN